MKYNLAVITERTKTGLTKKYRCACGADREFGVYVYAHWSDALVETCDCGRQNRIKNGVVQTPEKANK